MRDAFVEVLRAAGLECHATDEDVMRVFVPDERGAPFLFQLAAQHKRAGAAPAGQRPDARGRVRQGGRGMMTTSSEPMPDPRSRLSTLRWASARRTAAPGG